jgi:uncharacterized membrane protein
MPRTFASFLLDEAGGSWPEFVLLASLLAAVLMLVVLVLRKAA